MKNKLAKILYFIIGPLPTLKDEEAAEKIKANVVFRNAEHVPKLKHAIEICDGVAGAVPEAYKHLPTPSEAIKKKEAEVKKKTDIVGDSPAPELQDEDAETSESKPEDSNTDKPKQVWNGNNKPKN